MATFPGALFPGFLQQLTNAGVIAAGWKFHFLEVGTSTEKDTFSDADLSTLNANPVILDAYGRASIFLEPGGYDVEVLDENDVLKFTRESLEDIGLTFLSELGFLLAQGSAGVTSGYNVLATDQYITVDSTGGANPCIINLPPADDRAEGSGNALPLGIKQLGTVAIELRPSGTDEIESRGAGVALTIPAAADPTFPSVWLLSDGVSNWWVVSSHGFTVGGSSVTAGASAITARLGGVIYRTETPVGNVGAGEDVLLTQAIAAAVLSVNGQSIEMWASGTFGANAAAKRIRAYFGATVLIDMGVAQQPNGTTWVLHVVITRTGAATQFAYATLAVGADAGGPSWPGYVLFSTPAETLANAITLKITGEATTNNDIVAKQWRISWDPA